MWHSAAVRVPPWTWRYEVERFRKWLYRQLLLKQRSISDGDEKDDGGKRIVESELKLCPSSLSEHQPGGSGSRRKKSRKVV